MSAVGESQKAHQEQLKEVIKDLQEIKKRMLEQELETASEIQNRRKIIASELAQTEKIFAAQMETISEFKKNTLRMMAEIEAYTTDSSKSVYEKHERNRKASEQFLEDNRKLLKENANFLSNHMTHQIKIDEEPEERLQDQKAEAADNNGYLSEDNATEFYRSENRPHSSEKETADHDTPESTSENLSSDHADLLASDDEDKPDPYAQVPWTP